MNMPKTMFLLAAMTALFMGVGYLLGGAAGMLIAFVVAAGMNVYAYWNSDRLALASHNAQITTERSHPQLHGMVQRLSAQAGLPMPKVYVIDTPQPNAFATGRNPENAAVAATTGIMGILSEEELAGVMAHELAHIQNRDTLIMTITATFAGAISMLAQFAMFFRGGGRNRSAVGVIGVLLAVFLAPVAAGLIKMLVSRTREYAADRRGAEISGQPLALASALMKISGLAGRIEMPSAERNPASAHLFVVNPLSGARMDRLFSTHPNVENRIAALRAMAAGGGSGSDGPAPGMRRSRIPTIRRRRG